VKQTDKKHKRNNKIDRFITEAVLEERVTLKTNSIKIVEYIIGKINETSGLFYFGENSYQLYGLIEQRKKGNCTYIESSLNERLYPLSLNNNIRNNTKRLHMHIKRTKGGLFFCDEINDKIDIQVESDEVEDFHIKRGDLVNKKEFEEKMISLGYENVDTTKHKGEICARSGIIDVYPINEYYQRRLEFLETRLIQ
jgi:Transcription-repair coupling factor (superfamily II helicase)